MDAPQSGLLVVEDERFAGNKSLPYAGRHSLPPILLGLAIPSIAAAVIAPDILSNPALVFGFYLMALFVISAVIFIRSVFNPGSIVEATFDVRSKTATFVRYGTFASATVLIPFKDMGKVYIETHYDDDGYRTFMPLVELKNGEALQLPEGTTQAQIEAIRKMISS